MAPLPGFNLYGHDNDTYMFSDAGPETCPVCSYRRDLLAYNPDYVLVKTDTDISTTYDGFVIVSEAFKQFCSGQGYQNLKFGEFRHDRWHYNFEVNQQVKFDAERRRTRFEKDCPYCGNYESVIGATPSYLLVANPLADGFYRSDLIFGSGNEKHPLIFVGAETRKKLERAGLKGLEFSEALGIFQALGSQL